MRLGATQLLHDLSVLWLIAAPTIVQVVVRPVFRHIPSASERLLAWKDVLNRLLATLLGASLLAMIALLWRFLDRDPSVSFGAGLFLVGTLAGIAIGVAIIWKGPMRSMEVAMNEADSHLARRQMRRTRDCILGVGVAGFVYFVTTSVTGLSAFAVAVGGG